LVRQKQYKEFPNPDLWRRTYGLFPEVKHKHRLRGLTDREATINFHHNGRDIKPAVAYLTGYTIHRNGSLFPSLVHKNGTPEDVESIARYLNRSGIRFSQNVPYAYLDKFSWCWQIRTVTFRIEGEPPLVRLNRCWFRSKAIVIAQHVSLHTIHFTRCMSVGNVRTCVISHDAVERIVRESDERYFIEQS